MITLHLFVNCSLWPCQGFAHDQSPKTSPQRSTLSLSPPLASSSLSLSLPYSLSLVASLLVLSLGSLQLPVSRRFEYIYKCSYNNNFIPLNWQDPQRTEMHQPKGLDIYKYFFHFHEFYPCHWKSQN